MADEASWLTWPMLALESLCRQTTEEMVSEDGEVCCLRDLGVGRGFKLIATCTVAGDQYEWPGHIDAVLDATTAKVRWAHHSSVAFAAEADVQFVRKHKLFLEWEETDETPDEAHRLKNASLEQALKAQIDSVMFVTGTSVVLTEEDLDAVRHELHLNSWVLVDDAAFVVAPSLLHDKSTPALLVPWRPFEAGDKDRPVRLPQQRGNMMRFLKLLSFLLVSYFLGGGMVWSKVGPLVEEHAKSLVLLALGMIVIAIARNVIEKNRQVRKHQEGADRGGDAQRPAQPAMPAGAAQRAPKSPARGVRRR